MTKSLRLALVATGQLRDYPVIRLGSVADHLGPVKAQSLRQASRFANTLRAGYPVNEFEEFAQSRLILICVPPKKLPVVVADMAASPVGWSRKAIVVSGGASHSENLGLLKARGADVASLHPIAGPQQNRYFVEGDRLAVRAAKRLVESGGGRLVEIRKAATPLCEAGVSFASWLLVALVDASAGCFRKAGLTPGQAGPIVEWAALKTLRSYARGGRRAFRPPAAAEEYQAFAQALLSLHRADPLLAAYLLESARLALHRMGHGSAWLEACAQFHGRTAASGI